MKRRIIPIMASLILACISAASEGAETTLSVKGLNCAGCAAVFERQLAAIEGVTGHAVSAAKGEADVIYDPEKTDPGAIGVALLKKGFDVRLAPWEPVDATFNGCSNGLCGSRRANARARSQPGAAPGDDVQCPVSGVILKVKATTPRVEVKGNTIYVCCEGCRRHFEAHRDRVLALRGMRLSS